MFNKQAKNSELKYVVRAQMCLTQINMKEMSSTYYGKLFNLN